MIRQEGNSCAGVRIRKGKLVYEEKIFDTRTGGEERELGVRQVNNTGCRRPPA